MSRQIEYDRQMLLLKSMEIFWEKGYSDTSIQDIVKATNVKPGSLYAAFGNKEGLFKASTEFYFEYMFESVTLIFNRDIKPLEKIELFFDEILLSLLTTEKREGCLLVKTLMLMPTDKKELQSTSILMFYELEKLFIIELNKAKNDGTLKHKDTKMLAKFLINTIYGLHIYNIYNASKEEIKGIIDMQLKTCGIKK